MLDFALSACRDNQCVASYFEASQEMIVTIFKWFLFQTTGLMGILCILSGNQKLITSDYTPQINSYLSLFFVAHTKVTLGLSLEFYFFPNQVQF